MTDLLIFMAGFFVTLMVSAAVALLMWGASEEERVDEKPRVRVQDHEDATPRAKVLAPTHE